MKHRYIPIFLCAALAVGAMTGCSSSSDDTQEQTAEETTDETTDETADDSTDETAETEPVIYENEDLNFSAELPELLKDCMYVEVSETTAYDDTINIVKVYYQGEKSDQNIFTFEEMDQAVWDSIQAEGGPVGTELGVSSSGRVVVLNSMQSNPFEEGTDDYDKLNDIFDQMDIISETFTFLDE